MGSRIKESPESTFEVYLEVAHPGSHSSGPKVRRQFPEVYTDQETLQTLPKFCFPFSMDSPTVTQVGQNFTFVLTDIESKQRFGFCRLSSGAHTCYCILSYLPWFEVFYKLLNILADYTIKGQESQWQELLVSLHVLPIPEPGVPVHLGVHSFFTVPDTRELPSIPENRNLTEYFVAVDVNNMLHLYASMLYERRILICCSKLSTLTACVHGSAAMLYPMHWQHVYIPVLPQHLLDYCCAPMPYLIGVHSSMMERVRGLALDDVVILNVDTNTLETPYNDLESLPNDVVVSLKSRLKKVSTTTGDGVALAFLKSQAALFGSYRNALHIELGEPITFNEETFVNHRTSAMRQFLQNAIQLQLFKQFIDGRLDLLNSGEGFSDIFEEEINLGEYAGSDKTYHQWLFTVKRGGGAIFNTVKTKANPAMRTVYKFAKDHAKMRIKEVKSRLKQKEQAENGFSTGVPSVINDESSTSIVSSPSGVRTEGAQRTWDDQREITVHFGQARPPVLLKRPKSNLSLETSLEHSIRPTRHYTVFLSEDSSGDELQYDNDSISGFPDSFLFSVPFEWSPLPQPYHSLKDVELREGGDPSIGAESHTAPPSPVNEKFSNVNLLGDIFSCQDEPDIQPITLAKSLEDLRTPKDPGELQATFTYQRMDLCVDENSQTFPGLKLSKPYNKLWSIGPYESALPICAPPTCDAGAFIQLPVQTEAHSPSHESSALGSDPFTPSTPGNITIPRPHGRKTPELGTVLAPPMAQSRSKAAETGEGRTAFGGKEFRQALSMTTDGELLKSTNIAEGSIDLISLLDPLNSSANIDSTSLNDGGCIGISPSSCKPTLPPRYTYPQGLPIFPMHPHMSLNPFVQSLQPTSPQMHYSLTARRNPFSTVCGPPVGSYLHSPTQPQSISSLSGLYRQHSPGSSTLPHSYGPLQSTFSSSETSLLHSSASNHALSSLADSMSVPSTARNLVVKPLSAEADSQKTQDPFGDLMTMVKPATPPKKKVEDLRRSAI
ncbi:DENN domain-containing protein 1A isoform X2 [Hippoglossus hippoglossus]|uniref:DENN domain-containing protein 1A isoform X2 n=1 Tax=Hippoglossus hippoglossus TaxID=8267 RepID=UPI00148B8313|nr:DENN domain-containing protein 1A isoform X2 [Hippoglossus hippoglossus]XP_034997612.1 DENN domain-containing protein 1A isoform X2 [Hippoglossus stenolepis]